ncbi:MAG: hypothetical protein Q8P67_20985 [archaeon]|nr:hypothetical protein [archaeon]
MQNSIQELSSPVPLSAKTAPSFPASSASLTSLQNVVIPSTSFPPSLAPASHSSPLADDAYATESDSEEAVDPVSFVGDDLPVHELEANASRWAAHLSAVDWRWQWLQLRIMHLDRQIHQTETRLSQLNTARRVSWQAAPQTDQPTCARIDMRYRKEWSAPHQPLVQSPLIRLHPGPQRSHPLFIDHVSAPRRRPKRVTQPPQSKPRRSKSSSSLSTSASTSLPQKRGGSGRKGPRSTPQPATPKTPVHERSSLSSSSKKKKKSRTDWDIDNYVVDLPSSSTQAIPQYQSLDISTPTFRIVDDSSEPLDDAYSGEDTSDEAYSLRHAPHEESEKQAILELIQAIEKRQGRRAAVKITAQRTGETPLRSSSSSSLRGSSLTPRCFDRAQRASGWEMSRSCSLSSLNKSPPNSVKRGRPLSRDAHSKSKAKKQRSPSSMEPGPLLPELPASWESISWHAGLYPDPNCTKLLIMNPHTPSVSSPLILRVPTLPPPQFPQHEAFSMLFSQDLDNPSPMSSPAPHPLSHPNPAHSANLDASPANLDASPASLSKSGRVRRPTQKMLAYCADSLQQQSPIKRVPPQSPETPTLEKKRRQH